ncbi:MAG TPA: sugar-binding protein [Victivallales bacterium]|nr:sugar-binding protein [Victivallales bacterium]
MRRLSLMSFFLVLLFTTMESICDSETLLLDENEPLKIWSFGNGPEFPGAKGALTIDDNVEPQRRPALRLDADFTGGGNYVQAGRKLPDGGNIDSIVFWLKAPVGKQQITMRIIDGTDQCHQINYKISPDGNWQQINFPIARYFKNVGTSSSVEDVLRYEGWGGAKDGKWHNPAKALYILCGRNDFGDNKKGSIWISGVKIYFAPPEQELIKEVNLDEFMTEGELAWNFNDGREFPGAKGGVSIVKDDTAKDGFAVSLKGDFTGGGAYVDAGIDLSGIDILSIKMKLKTANTQNFNVRLIDSTKQCHQAKGIKISPDNKWHDIELKISELVGGEHWGGANDGKWHPGCNSFHILIGKGSSPDQKPEILISDLRGIVKTTVTVVGESYQESFENSSLPEKWNVNCPKGSSLIISDGAFDGKNLLRLQRNDSQLNDPVEVFGAEFKASPGLWLIKAATRSDLYSPDSSFAVRLNIECLDNSGRKIDLITIVDQTGKQNWKSSSRQVEFPEKTAKARFYVDFQKTHGYCDIDALSASPVASEKKEKIVERIEIGGEAFGNLFYPEDEIKINIDVQTFKPLSPKDTELDVVVTDYWGAEQLNHENLKLERKGVKNKKFNYSTSITIPKDKIEIGKYYELHVKISPENYEEASEYSAFARLPEAESRKYKPEEIPFTIRSWDNRIPAYMKLASRIGHRNLGVWGGWDKNDPTKVYVPTLELCLELGNKWVTGTPAADVERNGFKNYSEENLRLGMTNFLKKFADKGLAYICLGNEPPEKPEFVPEKVRAYKAVYEAVKAFDPSIKVIATSVGANKHFFDAGYQNYCDIYDFHVYETYDQVRQGVRNYKKMMKDYNAPKPIFSTELGLNSQGQTRYAVAQELVKKITVFFAEGGANVSWFGIEYPDPDGKARGTSGEAHNTFDCKYCKYNPKLDAIMYYNMINGITIKKFTDEVQHSDGVQSFLFRDDKGDAFHVLWREGGRIDHSIPLGNVNEIKLIRIDGSSQLLKTINGAITLGISPEPVLLRYKTENKLLPKELGTPVISIEDKNYKIIKGKNCEFRISGQNIKAEDITIVPPPRWEAKTTQDGKEVLCTITAPELTNARVGRILVQYSPGGNVNSEIIVPVYIMSPISLNIYADSRNKSEEPGIRVVISNNGTEKKTIQWSLELIKSWSINKGSFALQSPESVNAYLKGENEGKVVLEPESIKEFKAYMANGDKQTIYRVKATITDELGRKVSAERMIGGFATAYKTSEPIKIDGVLDEAAWSKAEPNFINELRQVFRFKGNEENWKGMQDLSAVWRALWDENNLYLAVEVTDDSHHIQFADSQIWNQDGLQFLFDPVRIQTEKAGKYDYSVGKGTKGEQAWCHLTADSSVPEGDVKDFKIAVKDLSGSNGGKIYELAIPWKRLAPFKPESGANLGMAMILNEDDGDGRLGFMGWFSGVHSKQLDLVGDLILK